MTNKFNSMTTRELISWTINYSGDIAAKELALDYERTILDIDDIRLELTGLFKKHKAFITSEQGKKVNSLFADLADLESKVGILCQAL